MRYHIRNKRTGYVSIWAKSTKEEAQTQIDTDAKFIPSFHLEDWEIVGE